MAAGYVVWLAGVTALTAIVPMQHTIIAAAVFLGLITIAAFVMATHFKKSGRRSVALAFWWAPTLPAVASIYSLIVFLK
jgi:ERCC4-related helicase